MKTKNLVKNKKISMLVCTILLLSLFAALPAGMAWEWSYEDTQNQFEHNMVEISDVVGPGDIYVGQQDYEFTLQIFNRADILQTLNELEISVEAVTGPGGDPTEWPDDGDVDEGPYTIAPFDTQWTEPFTFNVAGNAAPGEYEITFNITYEYDHDNDPGTDDVVATEYEYVTFEIQENTVVTEEENKLWAGKSFQQFIVNVENVNPDVDLEYAELTLSGIPGGVELRSDSAIIPEGIPSGDDVDFEFRADVEQDVPSGSHDIQYTFTANANGEIFITEQGTLDLIVEFSPLIEASYDEMTIDEGTDELTFDVTFENTGNVDLIEVYVELVTDGFFVLEVDHYEYGEIVTFDSIPLGAFDIGDEAVLGFTVGIDEDYELLEGRHMIQFAWEGWYYDDGTTNNDPGYNEVGVYWDQTVIPNQAYLSGVSPEDEEWFGPHIFLNVVEEMLYMPTIEAYVDEIIVEQGTTEVTFEVTFENTGEVDLNDVYVQLLDDGDFLILAVDHYEYGEGIRDIPVELGDLSVGDSVDIEFTIGMHTYLQEGKHMLQFDWNGWFELTDITGEVDRLYEVEVIWDQGVSPNQANLFGIHEDPVPWDGAHIFIHVVDDLINMEGFVDLVELDDDITYIRIEATLHNFELVGFRDLEVLLEVGENTPFYNPEDRSQNTVAMRRDESDTMIGPSDGDNEAEIIFYVNVNSDFVTHKLLNNTNAYVGNLVVTRAINVDTNQQIPDFDIPITVGLEGLGPRLVVEGTLDEENIVAGEIFTLTYTISNHGDDTARDTWVTMRPELYDNQNWDVLEGFIRAISTTETDFQFESKNVSGEVNLESLGIENAEEIADLHLYFEGALSAPRPHIWTLYVGEIAPGDSISVSFDMVSSRDMKVGQPYQETMDIRWMDSNGEPDGREFPITIRTGETGIEEEDDVEGLFGMESPLFEILLIAVIVIIALIIAMIAMARKVEKPPKEEEIPSEPDLEEDTWEEPSAIDSEDVEIEDVDDEPQENEEVW